MKYIGWILEVILCTSVLSIFYPYIPFNLLFRIVNLSYHMLIEFNDHNCVRPNFKTQLSFFGVNMGFEDLTS